MSKFYRVITMAFAPMFVAALLLAGCVAEMPDAGCVGCRLEFSFTRNSDGNERLMDDVHDIGLYVFDSATGVLVDVVGVEMDNIAHGGRMEYADVGSLPNGRYTFVAWGGGGNDIFRSFSARHMLDASSPTEPNQPMAEPIANLFTLLRLVSAPDVVKHFTDAYNRCEIRYGDMKKQLVEDIVAVVAPIRERIEAIRADEAYLHRVTSEGAERARASSAATLADVREIMGIRRF